MWARPTGKPTTPVNTVKGLLSSRNGGVRFARVAVQLIPTLASCCWGHPVRPQLLLGRFLPKLNPPALNKLGGLYA
jgi:hypothetical protein